MRIGTDNLTVVDCVFLANTAQNYGGAVNNSGDVKMYNCIFLGNSAFEGGGVYNSRNDTFASITSCVFSGNSASRGGGMANEGNGDGNYSRVSSYLINCVFSNNIGAGLYVHLSDSRVYNSIFWGNSFDGEVNSSTQFEQGLFGGYRVYYSSIQGWSKNNSYHNVNEDPLFVDADGPDDIVGTIDDDFRLQSGSPCIDTGEKSMVPEYVLEDLDGLPRIQNGLVDMGAYEFVTDCDNNGIADYQESDGDADGVLDICDNCPDDVNSSQIDSDGDGNGDACDTCPGANDAIPGVYSGGSGTVDDPLLISEPNQMLILVQRVCDWSKHLRLIADLDMSGIVISPIGNYDKRFTGYFDGAGHSISNLTMNSPQADNLGLFGYVEGGYSTVNIFDLNLVDPNIAGHWKVGTLVGVLYKGIVSGCHVYGGRVSGDQNVGGLAGIIDRYGKIYNCSANISVSGTYGIGGLAGANSNEIYASYAIGNVVGEDYATFFL